MYGSQEGRGLAGMNFDVPWNFIKEHVLHNFTKYFSGTRVNQIVNKDLNGDFSRLGSLSFSAP